MEVVATAMARELQRLSSLKPYSPDVLHSLRDFRILAGLRYIIGMCRELGIESELDAVLSFPWGPM